MSECGSNNNKISIVGAGLVGSTTAYAVMNSGLASEIVMIDIDAQRLSGEVMDLNHGVFFVPPVNIYAGDYEDCCDSRLVVLAAGVSQKEGETRLDLLKRNLEIFKDVVPQVAKHSPDCVLLVVTNPVDILTFATLEISGFPSSRVIGSGTLLDTARFRYLLSRNCRVDPHNVHAYVIGEHGDSEVPAWSATNIAGMPLEDFCRGCDRQCSEVDRSEIFESARNSAYEIIKGKGSTYYAVGLAVSRIIRAILRDEDTVLTVSSLMEGYYDVTDIALSLPSLVNAGGIARVLELPLTEEEVRDFRNSGDVLKDSLRGTGIA